MIKALGTLSNGATVIAVKSGVPGERCGVLAMWPHGKNGVEYVTWEVDQETGEAFWGHYFRFITDAALDFSVRWEPRL